MKQLRITIMKLGKSKEAVTVRDPDGRQTEITLENLVVALGKMKESSGDRVIIEGDRATRDFLSNSFIALADSWEWTS